MYDTPLDLQSARLKTVLDVSGVAVAVNDHLGYGKAAQALGVLLERVDEALLEDARPKPKVRIYTRLPGECVAAFDFTGTIEDGIKAVRTEGYPTGLVLVSSL